MVFQRATVIARKEDNGVLRQTKPIECTHNFTDVKIELIDVVAQLADLTRATELLVRRDVGVGGGQRQVDEEGVILVLLHKVDGFSGQRRIAFIIVSDPGQLIDGRLIGNLGNTFLQPKQVVILDVRLETVVVITRQSEMIIKADFKCARFDYPSPVSDAVFTKS